MKRDVRNAGASNRPDDRKKLGASGEAAAVRFISRLNYTVLHRNWSCRSGELDIVADDGGTLVFIEVRTRRDTGTYGTPLESVDARKQRQVRATAQMYLHAYARHDCALRFDVIAVQMDAAGELIELRHIMHAF